jgi:hypothetical protein
VVSQAEGDLDGKVAWRVEVELLSDPDSRPIRTDPRATTSGRRGADRGGTRATCTRTAITPRWGDAPMTEVFDYAFGAAGLDFVTLSDYVAGSAWGEIGRHQGRYPGKLIVPLAEVITYRGHANNHASGRFADYRTGPVLERADDGSLRQVRGPTPPSDIFDTVHSGGGWTQINHPTIFPSETPGFANLCRGCPWDYSDDETRWEKVDSYEVHTGPPGISGAGPNPFTVTAIEEWDGLRKRGFPITAVAVSDSHDAGEPDGPTESPLGTGRTVVFADELSEEGVRRGVQAGHAYVKVFGAASPDLRLDARAPDGSTAMMGDALPARSADFEARVTGGDRKQLVVLRDGTPIESVPIGSADFTYRFSATQGGRLPHPGPGGRVDPLAEQPDHARRGPAHGATRSAWWRPRGDDRPAATPRRVRAGRRARFTFTARTRSGALLPGATVRFAGRRVVTDSRGVGRMSMSLPRARTVPGDCRGARLPLRRREYPGHRPKPGHRPDRLSRPVARPWCSGARGAPGHGL